MNAVKKSLKIAAVIGLTFLASQIPIGRAQAGTSCVDQCWEDYYLCAAACGTNQSCLTACRQARFQCLTSC